MRQRQKECIRQTGDRRHEKYTVGDIRQTGDKRQTGDMRHTRDMQETRDRQETLDGRFETGDRSCETRDVR